MKVMIVGRTRMSGQSRCIGGVTEDGEAIRLLTSGGQNWDTSAPFQIGQVWDLSFTRQIQLVNPHTEDVLIQSYEYLFTAPDARGVLAQVNSWQGGIDQVFDGTLGYTGSNNGYVCQRLGVPPRSTGFWIPDKDLTLRADNRHYDYPGFMRPKGLSYVGEPQAVPSIPAGTLVRVSLARWWKPEDAEGDLEERCYLQLSGWY